MSEEYPEYNSKEGRWFRKVGDSIEYEPEITVMGGTIPVSQLDRYNKQKADSKNDNVIQVEKKKSCPFKSGSFDSSCESGCAYRMNDICVLSAPEGSIIDFNTLGGKCPISKRKCENKCALYVKGCSILKKGKE